MKTLEIIHLRLGGNRQHDLIEIVRGSMEARGEAGEAKIYRHARLDTDLAVHLQRESSRGIGQASNLGMRLASALREYGIVEHSLWVEEDPDPGSPPKSPASSTPCEV